MGYTRLVPTSEEQQQEVKSRGLRLPLHIALFAATFLSMLMAGAGWAGKNPYEISDWIHGLTYALLMITFLSAHEFGHYIAARIHKVDASLPFYIPFPFLLLNPFGTMGAVIRTRTAIPSKRALFDIGVAGPLAGFVVCIVILIVGFLTLPTRAEFMNYIFNDIHAEQYKHLHGVLPEWGVHFGDNLIFAAFQALFTGPTRFMPPMNEMYHYPFLCVGWFGLFVTSLNLLPIGQLDGGHITYAMFGKHHRYIARIVWWILLALGFSALLGAFHDLIKVDSPDSLYTFFQSALLPVLDALKRTAPWVFDGWLGWLVWALITRTLIKLDHPPIYDTRPIGSTRMAIGWLAILVFVLSVSYNGIYEIIPSSSTPSIDTAQPSEFVVIQPE